MSYREKILTAQIHTAAVRGLLNASQPMTGNLNASGRISDTPIHYSTTEEWNGKPELIGQKGHIYVYSDHSETDIGGEIVPVPNIKIGDGKAYLIDSPFVTASVEDMINTHISDDAVHVSEEDRAAWGDKIRCYIAPDDPENIIFTQENE